MTIHTQFPDTKKSPVVALHSSASSNTQWKQLTNDLEGRFEVIAPNLSASASDVLMPDDASEGLASIAQPVIDEIQKLKQPVHLVGHSNGGAIALKIALLRPDLIKSLTLFEPGVFHLLRDGDANDRNLFTEISGLSTALKKNTHAVKPDLGMKRFIDFWNVPGTWDQLPENGKQKFLKLVPTVISDFTRIFSETWELDTLKRLTMPTLLMMGMDSPQAAQRITTLLSRNIPGANLAMLPELGHMAPIFAPKWVNPRIFSHIANSERPPMNCQWPLKTAA